VFTSLTKEALPVIRYRTRDRTRLLPPTARAMRRLDKIAGRTDDMLIIRGVNVFPTQIEELILRIPQLTPQYRLIVTREGHLDALEVQVEVRAEAWPQMSAAVRTALGEDLRHQIKSYVGVSAAVTPMAPNGVERATTGKASRVLDKRPRSGG
jgi:phenylacetate-CoA ligase